jgi:glycosyltransferase involved in cell wall biosynthesis
MSPSQKPKLVVTGPAAVLQAFTDPVAKTGADPGIVCENLHSVRLSGAGDFKTQFVAAFDDFCRQLGPATVVLRPHPGGQYVLKNKVVLPRNATINNAPMYRLDLRRFAYGISAPSSVLVDMLLANIPTAVWRDRKGDMDANNYAGLTTVSTPAEWVEFARAAMARPEPFLQLQGEFMERQGLILDPADVYSRFAEIFRSVIRSEVRPVGAVAEQERLLFVANAHVPTLQLSFERPLAPLIDRGQITSELLTEEFLRKRTTIVGDPNAESAWIDDFLDKYGPSAIIFCRYSGPAYRSIIAWAKRRRVPVIYHIDDDLLAIPPEIGARKHALHNASARLTAVRELLESADLVYASTEKLRRKLLRYRSDLPIVVGKIYCSSTPLARPRPGRARKVGYMASADHAHNLERVIPAIQQMLERNPDVQLELFGSIPVPPALAHFGNRISKSPAVANYDEFLSEFARFGWDIGICPLAPIEFNLMKANTKWIEYTTVGAAVIASRGTVYDESCANGCGILADTPDQWAAALDLLIRDGTKRVEMVDRAQAKLESEYSIGELREQVLGVIARAHQIVREGEPVRPNQGDRILAN